MNELATLGIMTLIRL